MEILLQNQQNKYEIDTLAPLIEAAVRQTAVEEKIGDDFEVSLLLVDDVKIREMNAQYRNIDRATDVLSFALEESTDDFFAEIEEEGRLLGDIIISLERAEEQAQKYGHSLAREVGFLTVHGMLHLLGYDHLEEEEAKEMIRKQETILKQMGLERDREAENVAEK